MNGVTRNLVVTQCEKRTQKWSIRRGVWEIMTMQEKSSNYIVHESGKFSDNGQHRKAKQSRFSSRNHVACREVSSFFPNSSVIDL